MLRIRTLLVACALAALMAAPAGALSISSFFGKGYARDDERQVSFTYSFSRIFSISSLDFHWERPEGKRFDFGSFFSNLSSFSRDTSYRLVQYSHTHFRGCEHDEKPTPGIPEPGAILAFGLGLAIVGGVGLRRRKAS